MTLTMPNRRPFGRLGCWDSSRDYPCFLLVRLFRSFTRHVFLTDRIFRTAYNSHKTTR